MITCLLVETGYFQFRCVKGQEISIVQELSWPLQYCLLTRPTATGIVISTPLIIVKHSEVTRGHTKLYLHIGKINVLISSDLKKMQLGTVQQKPDFPDCGSMVFLIQGICIVGLKEMGKGMSCGRGRLVTMAVHIWSLKCHFKQRGKFTIHRPQHWYGPPHSESKSCLIAQVLN